MTQVIIHANENGGVSVTYPTGELPINEVLAKDCPEGAIIVDDSKLPTEDFDFWILNFYVMCSLRNFGVALTHSESPTL